MSVHNDHHNITTLLFSLSWNILGTSFEMWSQIRERNFTNHKGITMHLATCSGQNDINYGLIMLTRFRLDGNFVVDATTSGNVARFINHSCEPNCCCRVITSESDSHHIVIFASRDINIGEEITYDYKFNVEEESLKLKCRCGASSCLGRMN